jgi:dTDP-4-amino-4,6-dideoxygalactose transaminase
MEPYRTIYPDAGLFLPETEKLKLKVLQLPTGTAISEEDIYQICELIHIILTHGPEIFAHISS